eukprot:TRINITY_DN11761_c0_g4_i1.p1 TRINITY_DN11761_c0_g4~~TRINITY_DN11761_c0_g4_i1.p1  ORF type:complete len:377 (+),score=88.30 TRINITY_DN11761_c0_g4_i1:454-1584(+)
MKFKGDLEDSVRRKGEGGFNVDNLETSRYLPELAESQELYGKLMQFKNQMRTPPKIPTLKQIKLQDDTPKEVKTEVVPVKRNSVFTKALIKKTEDLEHQNTKGHHRRSRTDEVIERLTPIPLTTREPSPSVPFTNRTNAESKPSPMTSRSPSLNLSRYIRKKVKKQTTADHVIEGFQKFAEQTTQMLLANQQADKEEHHGNRFTDQLKRAKLKTKIIVNWGDASPVAREMARLKEENGFLAMSGRERAKLKLFQALDPEDKFVEKKNLIKLELLPPEKHDDQQEIKNTDPLVKLVKTKQRPTDFLLKNIGRKGEQKPQEEPFRRKIEDAGVRQEGTTLQFVEYPYERRRRSPIVRRYIQADRRAEKVFDFIPETFN